ncbi:hypothetical protein [Achromobacter sp. K91]|uniref:hypothetical protein n=1 Tax=Achromobacter sp. K91 TaxID=2292262 RepID=UPI0013143717|nr:hypothetical protein [Achromobacter sp. K91]
MRQIKLSVMKGTVQRNGLLAMGKASGLEGGIMFDTHKTKKPTSRLAFFALRLF